MLPSASLVVDYDEDILLRAGIYRGMSRADPSDLGYSRTFQTDDASDPETIDDLLVGANGSGNPDLQPLMSWNYDAAFEWYPNEDSIFALSLYYKQFQGGFQQRTVIEDFVVGGETVSLPITNSVTNDEESEILGLETSFSYRWDNGIGVKFGYNYADTDFEFEDSLYGDTFVTDVDGNTTQLKEGDKVVKGQVIARLDQTDFKIQLNDKQAGYDKSKANFTRSATLLEPGHISQREYDEIKAAYSTAEAHLKTAKQNLIYTELKAPFDGSITKTHVDNFEEIMAKNVIATLQDLTMMQIEIDVPE